MRRFAMAVALAIATGSVAQAATLSKVEGDVLVNTGRGFPRGVLGQQLKAGDRVMVGRPGGNATISYDISCLERVPTGRVIVVQVAVPCNAPGANTSIAPVDAVALDAVPAIPGGATALIVGGAVGIAAGVLIYQATKDSSSSSP